MGAILRRVRVHSLSCRGSNGSTLLTRRNREKSRSVVYKVAPCSTASAARCASVAWGADLTFEQLLLQEPPMALGGIQTGDGRLLQPVADDLCRLGHRHLTTEDLAEHRSCSG